MTSFQGISRRDEILCRMRDRSFSGTMVRDICSHAYGREISTEAWKNWRSWARIPKSKRTYTFKQFCFLYAVASIRAKEHDRYRQLRESEVNQLAESLEVCELLSGFISFFDTEMVVGKDAPAWLALKGVRVSLKTLYKKIPGFSVGKIYRLEDLKFWAVG